MVAAPVHWSTLAYTAQTLAWLEKAYAEHSGEMVTPKVSPAYDLLRADPRFRRLLEQVGLGK